MDKVYISWTIENWITVVLMVALGYFLVSLVASFVRSRMGQLGAMPAVPLTGSQQPGSMAASLVSGG